jgi:hypothetical protein
MLSLQVSRVADNGIRADVAQGLKFTERDHLRNDSARLRDMLIGFARRFEPSPIGVKLLRDVAGKVLGIFVARPSGLCAHLTVMVAVLDVVLTSSFPASIGAFIHTSHCYSPRLLNPEPRKLPFNRFLPRAAIEAA